MSRLIKCLIIVLVLGSKVWNERFAKHPNDPVIKNKIKNANLGKLFKNNYFSIFIWSQLADENQESIFCSNFLVKFLFRFKYPMIWSRLKVVHNIFLIKVIKEAFVIIVILVYWSGIHKHVFVSTLNMFSFVCILFGSKIMICIKRCESTKNFYQEEFCPSLYETEFQVMHFNF